MDSLHCSTQLLILNYYLIHKGCNFSLYWAQSKAMLPFNSLIYSTGASAITDCSIIILLHHSSLVKSKSQKFPFFPIMPGAQERVGTGDTWSCFYNLCDAQQQLSCKASSLHSSYVKALENSYSWLLARNVLIKKWILKRFLHPRSGLYFGKCPSSYFNMRKDMASQIIKIAQHNKNLATSFPKENS